MTTFNKRVVALCFVCGAALASFGATYYASPDGTGDGSSWDNPSGDVKSLYDAAQSGDEIWLKAGIYKQSESIMMKSGVTIQGGFLGGEKRRAEAMPRVNQTILHGMNPNVIYCYNINTVRTPSMPIWKDDKFIPLTPDDEKGIVYFGLNKYTWQTDLSNIFTNGVDNVADCEIAGLTFVCSGGAAISIKTNAVVTVNDCQFFACYGGGVSAQGTVTITNSYFRNNATALSISSNIATATNRLVDCVFEVNSSESYIIDFNSSTPCEIIGCTFDGNTAYERGGNSVSAVILNQRGTGSRLTIRDCVFKNNRVRTGSKACQALIKFNAGTTILERNIFIENNLLQTNNCTDAASTLHCAGLYISNSCLVRDCAFYNNSVKGYSSLADGGVWTAVAYVTTGGSASFLNCTFKGNTVDNLSQTEDLGAVNKAAICKLNRNGNGVDNSIGTAFVNCLFDDNEITGNAGFKGIVALDATIKDRYEFSTAFINTIIKNNTECPSLAFGPASH